MKLFLTVGTQLPFDRLVQAVDDWAGRNESVQVFGQVGPARYEPQHIEWARFINVDEFRRHVADSSLIVAHAGMGSILTALEMGKPILVMPRRADLMEHRNDHQLATARQLLRQRGVNVAFDEAELPRKLDRLEELVQGNPIPPHASSRLLTAIRSFVSVGAQVPAASPGLYSVPDERMALSRME